MTYPYADTQVRHGPALKPHSTLNSSQNEHLAINDLPDELLTTILIAVVFAPSPWLSLAVNAPLPLQYTLGTVCHRWYTIIRSPVFWTKLSIANSSAMSSLHQIRPKHSPRALGKKWLSFLVALEDIIKNSGQSSLDVFLKLTRSDDMFCDSASINRVASIVAAESSRWRYFSMTTMYTPDLWATFIPISSCIDQLEVLRMDITSRNNLGARESCRYTFAHAPCLRELDIRISSQNPAEATLPSCQLITFDFPWAQIKQFSLILDTPGLSTEEYMEVAAHFSKAMESATSTDVEWRHYVKADCAIPSQLPMKSITNNYVQKIDLGSAIIPSSITLPSLAHLDFQMDERTTHAIRALLFRSEPPLETLILRYMEEPMGPLGTLKPYLQSLKRLEVKLGEGKTRALLHTILDGIAPLVEDPKSLPLLSALELRLHASFHSLSRPEHSIYVRPLDMLWHIAQTRMGDAGNLKMLAVVLTTTGWNFDGLRPNDFRSSPSYDKLESAVACNGWDIRFGYRIRQSSRSRPILANPVS